MSLREFWSNVRTGARLIAPEATVDSPRLNAEVIERVLRQATHWLTPRTVVGFNEADFDFLPDAERTKLGGLVNAFREIALQVPPLAPATDEQIARALPLFRDLVAMLEFDRYLDADAYRLGKQIERAIESQRPPELVDLRFKTGLDNTGDPGIWVWAFLSDEEDEQFLRRAHKIRPLLDWASRTVAPELLPYISFRSVAEQAELEAEMK